MIDKNQKLADKFSIIKSLKEYASPPQFWIWIKPRKKYAVSYVNTIQEAEEVQKINQ